MSRAYFHKCVEEWQRADEECRRTFAIWNEACERRVRLAEIKNAAYEEWQHKVKQRERRKPR